MKTAGIIILMAGLFLSGAAYAVTHNEFIYRQTEGVDQDLRVYYPDGWSSGDTRMCMVLFHGGGWSSGDKAQFYNVCQYFAERGWVTITANYRVWTEAERAALPEGATEKTICVKDAKSTIRWVKNNHAMLGIDPKRLVAGGGSAGGHISVLAVLDDEHNHPDDPAGIDTDVLGLLLWNPAFTFEESDPTPEVNVFVHYDKPLPPTLFMFGDQDSWMPRSSELFSRMRQRGDLARFWEARDKGHNYWTRDPWLRHTILLADRFLVDLNLLPPGESYRSPLTDAVPAELTAHAGEEKVDLNWRDVSGQPGFEHYKVYRAATSGTNYVCIASNVVQSVYEDREVDGGVGYYYVVKAVANGLESDFSNEYGANPFAFVNHSGSVELDNNDDSNPSSMTWTLSGLSQTNPVVVGNTAVASGMVSTGGDLGAGDGFSLTLTSVIGWNATNAQAAIANNNFSSYLTGLTPGKVDGFQGGLMGADSRAVYGGDISHRIGENSQEALVYTIGPVNLSAGALYLREVSFAYYGVDDRTDFVIYDVSENRVVKAGWDANYNAPDSVGGSWKLASGDKIIVGAGASTGAQWFRVDKLTFDVAASGVEAESYTTWRAGFYPEAIGSMTNDFDGDGVVNLAEYAFAGDPTNQNVVGEAVHVELAGDRLQITHPQRTTDPNLVYSIETTTNLSTAAWHEVESIESSTNVTGSVFNQVTNSIPTVLNQGFFKINAVQQ